MKRWVLFLLKNYRKEGTNCRTGIEVWEVTAYKGVAEDLPVQIKHIMAY
jgi:hypothetical protein